jgi:hypothetical protein
MEPESGWIDRIWSGAEGLSLSSALIVHLQQKREEPVGQIPRWLIARLETIPDLRLNFALWRFPATRQSSGLQPALSGFAGLRAVC